MVKSLAKVVACVVGICLLPLCIMAQKPTAKATNDSILPTFFITETKPSFISTSRNIVSMTNSEMKEHGAMSLSDALAQLPGVSQLTTGAISKPVIRGLYGNRLQVNVGGMRFDNQQWQDEHGLGLSDMGVERVELIKGPAALLFGSDAMGGVVNVIEEGFPSQSALKQIQSFNLKTFSNTYGIGLDYGFKKHLKNTLILRGGFESHADYSDGKGNRILNSRFATYNLKGGYLINKDHFQSENRVQISFSQFGFILDTFDRKATDNRLSRQFDGPHHSVFFTVLTSKNTFSLKNDAKLTITGGIHTNLRQEQEGGNRISLNMFLNTFSIKADWEKPYDNKLTWINGAAGMWQNNTNYGSRIIIPDATTTEGSVYSYLKKRFLYDKLNFEAGLRYDRRHIRTFLTSDLNPPTSPVAPFSRPFDALNGSAGLTYNKDFKGGHFDIKSDVATGYRSGNLAELSANGLHEGTKRWEVGDAQLKVEQCLNADLSANLHLFVGKGEFILRGSVYRNRFLNYIHLAPTGKEYVGFDIYAYKQADATLKGFETGVTYWQSRIKWTVDYAYLDARRDDGTWLPFTPANRLQSEIKVFLFKNKAFLQDSYLTFGASFTQAQTHPAEFETATPHYTLLNMGAGTTYKRLRFLLTCRNLTNEYYNDHLSRFKYFGIRDMGRDMVLNVGYQF